MNLIRLFSTEKYKGTRNYLNSQKKYEVIRTILYFGISFSLFAAGYLTTHSKANLLTIVAILGCLPASKSAVSAIMFLRFRSCSESAAEAAGEAGEGLMQLYDCVFTSAVKNFAVAHLAVKGNTICGYTEDAGFDEKKFYSHIDGILKTDGHKDVTVKIFTDLQKYTERLRQMRLLPSGADDARTESLINTLKSVSL